MCSFTRDFYSIQASYIYLINLRTEQIVHEVHMNEQLASITVIHDNNNEALTSLLVSAIH